MEIKFFLKYIFFLVMILVSPVSIAQTQWQSLDTGLDYTALTDPPISKYGKLHAFRIDLNRYELDLATAQDYGKQSTKVYSFAKNADALIAINGGFFDPGFIPLGLRSRHGKILSSVKPISWWGIFLMRNNHPYIIPPNTFSMDKNVEFAIQSGPRLLVNGEPPSLKPGFAERSALCITHDGRLVIMATENAPLTTKQLADIIKQSDKNNGLNCYNALNLDGGSSTQLYASINDFSLNIFSFHDIVDGIIVKKKVNEKD